MKNNNKTHSQKQKNNVKWYKNTKFLVRVICIFFTAPITLFAINEILLHYNIYFLEFASPLLTYILISIIVALIQISFEISKFYEETLKTPEGTEQDVAHGANALPLPANDANNDLKNDSIFKMITEASDDKRYVEVVKIGTAVSDALWYSGRHKLRLEIAPLIERAARTIKDNYVLSKVLIEDLGNGYLDTMKDPNKAIHSIRKGIKIAQENKYYYLVARGHRNVACAYAFKYKDKKNQEDLDCALTAYNLGVQSLNNITNNYDKLDASGSLYYALYRITCLQKKYEEAKRALDYSMSCYEELSTCPDRQIQASDRLIKIRRELGGLYLRDPNTEDDGVDLLNNAIEDAKKQRDYTNALKAGVILLKYYRKKNDIVQFNATQSDCKHFVNNVDDENLKNAYNNITYCSANTDDNGCANEFAADKSDICKNNGANSFVANDKNEKE